MDYLLVIFLSLLTPFSLTMSDIDYTTGLGIKVSNSTDKNALSNKITASSIKTGTRGDNDIVRVQHYGPYGIFFDLSVEYQIYPFLDKNNLLQNFWVAPKFSYEPLRDSALVTMKPISSSRTKAVPIMFNQHPSFGFNLGYDAYHFKKSGETISPYFGIQFMRVGYEGESNFDMQELFDSSIQYNVGLSYRMDENWAANIELSNTYIDLRGVEGQNQDITAKLTRVKFGVTYYLGNNIAIQKENKDVTYIGIMKSIDPNFKNKVKEKQKLDEKERLETKKLKEEAIKQQKKEEEERKKEEKQSKEEAKEESENHSKLLKNQLVKKNLVLPQVVR